MGAKGRYLEAMQRADERDAARAAKKDRAQKRAQARAHAASVQSSPVQTDQDVLASVPSTAAQVGGESQPETQTKPGRKTCLCHKGQNRPMDSHGCCKATIDSIRFSSRMPADVDLDDVARVQAIIDSGVIKRALTKAELAARREERGTATALKEVANANNKPVVLTPKPDLPDGVNFFDQNQARYLGKCVLMRGMNFAAGVSDAYPKLSPYEAGVLANAAEHDPNVRAAIEQEASQRGLGDSDKQIFVGLLWKHATSLRPQDYQDRGTAMRILSKVFIEQQAQQQQPVSLHIEGISEGLARMGLTPDVLATVPAMVSAEMPDLKDEDFEKEEDE